MHKEDKIALAIGFSLIAVGTVGILVIDAIAAKKAKEDAKAWSERQMELGWETIQNSKFFRIATPEQRIKLFDTYWGTTGGIRR